MMKTIKCKRFYENLHKWCVPLIFVTYTGVLVAGGGFAQAEELPISDPISTREMEKMNE
jgi:hypothetical protein